jgi:hypothetical protein
MSMIGKTLGSFECTALLGKGGMGEVYQAKDQKLGRDIMATRAADRHQSHQTD